jgi:serine/threonine protein kinase
MGPEQICGEKVDKRTDILLGILLYEMLAGTIPSGSTTAVLMKHINGRRRPSKEYPLICRH